MAQDLRDGVETDLVAHPEWADRHLEYPHPASVYVLKEAVCRSRTESTAAGIRRDRDFGYAGGDQLAKIVSHRHPRRPVQNGQNPAPTLFSSASLPTNGTNWHPD